MSRRVTTEDFIKRAKDIHGDRYDYSLVKYVDAKTHVDIICKLHGVFRQVANTHLSGSGCQICGGKVKITTEEFIYRAKQVHGDDQYDYSKTIYTKNYIKVTITCPKHNDFEQTPSNHLNGYGCAKCAGNVQSTTEEFIKKAVAIHADKYDYTLVDYKNCKTEVEIICKKCNQSFFLTPLKHLTDARGCLTCSREELSIRFRKSREKFIEEANNVHNNFYDYSLLEYKNDRTKITIICPKHGKFRQAAGSHLAGNGCKYCNATISKISQRWLKLLLIPDDKHHREKLIKLPKRPWYKVDGFDPILKICYFFDGDFWHGNPETYHSDAINPKNCKTFGELYKKTLERNKRLKAAGYRVITIWESVFKKKMCLKQ